MKWAKWKYIDHGHPKEWTFTQIGSDVKSVEQAREYLMDHETKIPTWSERFLPCRIEVKLVRKPPVKFLLESIKDSKYIIASHKKRIKRIQGKIEQLYGIKAK